MSEMPFGFPIFKAFTTTGSMGPLAGGKLFTFAAGTAIPLAAYQDAALTVPHANPIVLDANGQATVYLGPGPYKITLQDASSVLQPGWPIDDIPGHVPDINALLADFADTSDVALGDALIGVKAAFTSAIGTTQHEVNGRTYSIFENMTSVQKADVRAFTGSIDVTAPCQAVLTWVGANGGGIVQAPAGKYKISGSGLSIPPGVHLVGAGGGSPSLVNNTMFVAASAAVVQLILVDAVDASVTGCLLYGEATNAIVGLRIGLNGYAANSPGRIHIKNVLAQECKFGFHTLNGAFLVKFEDCVAWNGVKGFYFDNTAAATYGGTSIIQRGGNIVTMENCHTVSNSEHGTYAAVSNCVRMVNCGFDFDATGVQFTLSSGEIVHCTSDDCPTASIVSLGSKIKIEDVVFLRSSIPINAQDSFGPSQLDIIRCKSTATTGTWSVVSSTTSRLAFKANLFDKAINNDGERFGHDYRTECGYASVSASGTPGSLTKAITFSRPFLRLKGLTLVPETQYATRIDTLVSGGNGAGFTAEFYRDDGANWANGNTQTFYWTATGVDHPLSIFEGSTATNVLTLSTTVSGYFALGQVLVGTGIAAGTTISTLASGVLGVAGSTYTLSTSPGTLAAATLMTA